MIEMKYDDLSNMLMDMYDLRRAIPEDIQALPKDNEGTELTIGDLIESVIETLEAYDDGGDE